MSILDRTIKDFLLRQRLGYVATVSSNHEPNLSPKGTIFVWDDSHLVFANIRSPQTIKNLQTNPNLEINVVDPISRKGYRFKGTGNILNDDTTYEKIILYYEQLGIKSKISDIVLVAVSSVSEIRSPIYDTGLSEEQIRKTWKDKMLDSH